MDEAKTLSILVKPGWKKGTKISFVNEGDEGPGLIASDIEFIVQEKENSDPGYVRDGNNLIYTHKLSLSDALTDHNGLQVRTLDSRIISIACPEVVSPFYEKIILGSNSSIALREIYFMCLSLCVLVRRGNAHFKEARHEGRPDRPLPHPLPQVPQRREEEQDQGATRGRRAADMT